MGDTWSFLTMDGDGVAYSFGTGTSIVIETPVGGWPQPIVISTSQTGTAILKGSYVVYWSLLSVLPTTMQCGLLPRVSGARV
jgi:hypothetical protein